MPGWITLSTTRRLPFAFTHFRQAPLGLHRTVTREKLLESILKTKNLRKVCRYRRRAFHLLLLTFILSSLPLAAQSPPVQVTILRAARLIDGTGAAPILPGMIRIEGERIVEIGSNVRIPSGARVIDLGDATLLPGLIDLHTHLTGDERVHWEEALTKSTPARDALWGARNARITLLAGFTSCRDMGPV